MKTWNAKPDEIERKWWIVDAKNQTVGRIATQIASVLRGKHKAEFTPHIDTGDFVVVINSDQLKFTGNKLEDKKYYRHTGFFGGIKELTAKQLFEKDSTLVIEKAVRGMLPRNRLGRQLFTKLKAYAGPEHPHDAQKPEAMNVKH